MNNISLIFEAKKDVPINYTWSYYLEHPEMKKHLTHIKNDNGTYSLIDERTKKEVLSASFSFAEIFKIMTIDYEKLVGCCSYCERQGFKIIENGFCHTDLYDNGICMDCYDVLIQIKLAKRFSPSNLSKPMPLFLHNNSG